MKRWGNIGDKVPAAVFMGLLVLLWEIGGKAMEVPSYIIPLPSQIGRSLLENQELLFYHAQATMTAALWGILAASLLGVGVAVLMDRLPLAKRTLYPLLVVSQTIPIIALAPILMIWFGLGLAPKILTVTLVCFFPMAVTVTESLAQVEEEAEALFIVMGAGLWQTLRHLHFPAVLPGFFAGLKIAATYSVMGAVIGEWLGGNRGLGVFIIRSMHTYNVSQVFAAILVVVALSLLLFGLTSLLARVTMPWQEKGEKS